MKNQPLVSICIPTYNAAAFLQPCLLSAINQTYTNLEILISDDASSDATIGIITRFQEQDSRIRLIRNPAAAGMAHNWNRCIDEARGEWVKFLFQDDLLEPGCVEEMLAACYRTGVQVALCRRNFIIHENAPTYTRRFFTNSIKAEDVFDGSALISPEQLAGTVRKYFVQNVLGEPTCYLFHRNLCRRTGAFRTDLLQMVDYEFILRLGLVDGLAFVAQPLANFRIHGHSQSSLNTRADKNTTARTILADTGDFLLLVNSFLHDPNFWLIKNAVGVRPLENFLQFYYHSACKHKGVKPVNKALCGLFETHKNLQFRYRFFKYVYYRFWVNRWRKQAGESPFSV